VNGRSTVGRYTIPMRVPTATWRTGAVSRLGAGSAARAYAALVDRGDGPVPLLYRPRRASTTSSRALHELLDAVADAARDLYPAWPPGAAELEADGGASGPAIRLLASRTAEARSGFAPFWAHAAARARSAADLRGAFPIEVEGRELPRLLELAWGREELALLVDLEGVPTDHDPALASALEWLAFHGRLAVLVGPTSDRSAWSRYPALPPVDADDTEPIDVPPDDRLAMPAPPGRPHPHSDHEQALHAALQGRDWTHDVVFNKPVQIGAFGQTVIVDVMFTEARVVIELDGDEHRGRRKYQRDRIRDNELTALGHAVHRFTNDEIESDLQDVLARLERYVAAARRRNPEGGRG